jgi:hypothetical protein
MFILSANKLLNPELRDFNRLYAYPTIPDLDDEKTILLDSGAYMLSMQRRVMTLGYIDKLAAHYQHYAISDNIHCIAPDCFKNPVVSIRQYRHFVDNYSVPIAPVLQFVSSEIDLFNTKKQIDTYARLSKSRMICLSNNKFNPVKQSRELLHIVDNIRRKFSNTHIHVLGAGYNHNNVKDWMKLGIDSMDSVSYYTDAQHRLAWRRNSYETQASDLSFKEIALHNARTANEI